MNSWTLSGRSAERLAGLAAALALAAAATTAGAADYPARPIRLIVPFAPGGNADIVGRTVAQGLTERLGQQVIVDNRPGGSSVIGTEIAVRATPDGYTLLLVASTFAVNPNLKKLPYDTLKDLAPISLVGSTPQVLVTGPAVPVATAKELLAYAKARPGQLNYGSTGVGTTANMAGALLNMMAGIQLVHVPYKGTQQTITDVIGGRLHVAIPSMTSSIPHIRAKRVKALAVTSAKRSSALPDVPTIAESGVPGYQAVIWNGVLGPADTPKPVLDRLSSEIAAVMRGSTAAQRYESMGAEAMGTTAEEFAKFLRAEIDQYARVIQASGMRSEISR